MKSVNRQLWAGVFVSLVVGSSVAGTAADFLGVSITLNNPGVVPSPVSGAPMGLSTPRPGVCISETLSQQTQALVRVVCGTGQFVSIAPMPGKPFLGTHGGAFRYNMGGGMVSAALPSDAGNPYRGVGAVTALRVFNANGSDGPLELLVSF